MRIKKENELHDTRDILMMFNMGALSQNRALSMYIKQSIMYFNARNLECYLGRDELMEMFNVSSKSIFYKILSKNNIVVIKKKTKVGTNLLYKKVWVDRDNYNLIHYERINGQIRPIIFIPKYNKYTFCAMYTEVLPVIDFDIELLDIYCKYKIKA